MAPPRLSKPSRSHKVPTSQVTINWNPAARQILHPLSHSQEDSAACQNRLRCVLRQFLTVRVLGFLSSYSRLSQE